MDSGPRRPFRASSLFVLGVVLGSAVPIVRHALSTDPILVRVSSTMLLRGGQPSATQESGAESRRLARARHLAARPWPSAPLRTWGRAPVADEGILRQLPGAEDLALTWLHLPGASPRLATVHAWPSAQLSLEPWDGRPEHVVAWIPADTPTPRPLVALTCHRPLGDTLLLHAPGGGGAALDALAHQVGCRPAHDRWTAGRRLRPGLPTGPALRVLRSRPGTGVPG